MTTLSTNLKFQKATTQFTNFPFNSMCNFNGKQLGAGPAGLCEMGGGTDAGVAISAYFEPVRSDWGMTNPKRVRFMYFGYECDGALTVTITGEDGKNSVATIPCKSAGAQQHCRVTVSRQVHGRYLAFKIGNTNGADFSIDAVDAMFIVRSNGIAS